MSLVKEMRQQQVMTVAPEPSGFGTIALTAFATLLIGALAIAGWTLWPSSRPAPVASTKPQPTVSQPAPSAARQRPGQAEIAPVLNICIKESMSERMSPQAYFMMINSGTNAGAFAKSINPNRPRSTRELAEFWNTVAECLFQQSSWNPCDVDNRAFAVAAITASVRQSVLLATSLEGQPDAKSQSVQTLLANTARSKQAVLNGLRTNAHNGFFVAADFEPAPPPEIKAIFAQAKPVANRCPR